MIIYKHFTMNQFFYNMRPTSTFIVPLPQVQAWSCICSMCNNIIIIFFFGVPYSATFIFIVFHVCNGLHRLHPSSIRCRGLNPWPLDHEPTALTTRPWLLPLCVIVFGVSIAIVVVSCFPFITISICSRGRGGLRGRGYKIRPRRHKFSN